jgi:hypothetical protein
VGEFPKRFEMEMSRKKFVLTHGDRSRRVCTREECEIALCGHTNRVIDNKRSRPLTGPLTLPIATCRFTRSISLGTELLRSTHTRYTMRTYRQICAADPNPVDVNINEITIRRFVRVDTSHLGFVQRSACNRSVKLTNRESVVFVKRECTRSRTYQTTRGRQVIYIGALMIKMIE